LLCLHEDPIQMEQLPKAKFVKDYFAFNEDLKKKGHLEAGDSLQPGHAPTTIRSNHGKAFTSYGPQENIKNTIGGFYVIKAAIVASSRMR